MDPLLEKLLVEELKENKDFRKDVREDLSKIFTWITNREAMETAKKAHRNFWYAAVGLIVSAAGVVVTLYAVLPH